jgi:hypothetical protein
VGQGTARSNVGRDAAHGIVVAIEAEGSRRISRSPDAPRRPRGTDAPRPVAPSVMDAADNAAARERLLSRALAELSHAPRLARWLPGSVGPGTRAAAALLVATVCASVRRELDPAAHRTRSPLRAALTAAWSRQGYLAAIDDAIRTAIAARAPGRDEPTPASGSGAIELVAAVVPAPTPAAPASAGPPPRIVLVVSRLSRRWRALRQH